MSARRRSPVVVLAVLAASLAAAHPGVASDSAVWRLVETKVNPDGKELGAASSGITAEVGPGLITWQKKGVDRGRVVQDVRVRFTIGAPPGELRPGQTHGLRVQGSLEGFWPDGWGAGNTLRFSGYGGLGLKGAYGIDVNPSDRNPTLDLVLQASTSMAETVELEAGGLNWCPGCRVVWVYKKVASPPAVPPPPLPPLPPPPQFVPGPIICNAWDVRLSQPNPVTPGSRQTFTEWRGRWVRARNAPCYQATWESLSTGQQIVRGVCPKNEGQVVSFWSDDGSGGRITYFTGTFGGPVGQIQGEYDYQKGGTVIQTGTWTARCTDPGPFQPTW